MLLVVSSFRLFHPFVFFPLWCDVMTVQILIKAARLFGQHGTCIQIPARGNIETVCILGDEPRLYSLKFSSHRKPYWRRRPDQFRSFSLQRERDCRLQAQTTNRWPRYVIMQFIQVEKSIAHRYLLGTLKRFSTFAFVCGTFVSLWSWEVNSEIFGMAAKTNGSR